MRIVTLLAAAAALLLGPPAWSQAPSSPPAAAPTDAKMQQAVRVVRVILVASDFRARMLEGMEQGTKDPGSEWLAARPEWSGLMREAMVEEIDANQGKLELILARHFAAQFTIGELRAGADFLESPGVAEALRESLQSEERTPPPPQVQKPLERLSRSPDGRSFGDKFAKSDIAGAAKDEIVAAFVPGIRRRFMEKLEAAEAAKAPPGQDRP